MFDILILVLGITGVLVRSTGMFAPQGCLLSFSFTFKNLIKLHISFSIYNLFLTLVVLSPKWSPVESLNRTPGGPQAPGEGTG